MAYSLEIDFYNTEFWKKLSSNRYPKKEKKATTPAVFPLV